MNTSITLLDTIVFISVFILTLLAVAYGRHRFKKSHHSEDKSELLLMGRKITLPLFVVSLVASWYGEISGVTAFTFEHGLFSFLTQSLVWYVAYLIFAFILIKKIPKTNASTFPELVGNHLGPRAYRITSVLTILGMIPIASVLAIGIFLHFLTGWPTFLSSAIGVVCIFSYSMSGGLRSVVFADVVQFTAMVSAVIMVALFSILNFGPPSHLVSLLPPEHLQLTGGKPFSEIFIWSFIAMSTLVDPLFYQRALAARDEKQARAGILWATLVWFIFDCSAVIGALYARAHMPSLPANESYLRYAMEILPSGLRGFLLAGVFSAIVSSLDSHLFSASSMVAFDLLKKDKFNKRRLQLAMVGVGLGALLITPFFDNIATVWKVMGALSSSCLLFPWLLMMVFPKYKSEVRFLSSVFAGILLMIIGAIFNYLKIEGTDVFYYGLTGSILGFLFSLGFGNPSRGQY
jgi:SSS family solute:Na+ symporter